jgi:hypothetical protein
MDARQILTDKISLFHHHVHLTKHVLVASMKRSINSVYEQEKSDLTDKLLF